MNFHQPSSTAWFGTRLRNAVCSNDITTVRRLSKGGIEVNSHDQYGSTLLHDAAKSGSADTIKVLMKVGASSEIANKEGRVPLHIAARLAHTQAVRALLDSGAKLNTQNKDGLTALHIAVWRCHRCIIQELLDFGACTDITDNEGWTALHWAARMGDTDVMQRLLDHGATMNIKDKDGLTALHICMNMQTWTCMRLLISQGADSNIHPKNGSTLSLLCKQSSCTVDIIRTLLNVGYDIKHDDWYNTAADLPDLLDRHTALHRDIRDKLRNTQSLVQCCRAYIRHRITYCHGGTAIRNRLLLLPLPVPVTQFLAYDEEYREEEPILIHDVRNAIDEEEVVDISDDESNTSDPADDGDTNTISGEARAAAAIAIDQEYYREENSATPQPDSEVKEDSEEDVEDVEEVDEGDDLDDYDSPFDDDDHGDNDEGSDFCHSPGISIE